MTHRHRRLAAIALAAAFALRTFAAPKPPLEALDDNRLMDELAGRGMTPLLDYYFAKNKVPADRQQEIRVVSALRNLDSDAFARKGEADQRREIEDVVDGINRVLPTIQDPERLMRYASGLLINGTERPMNTMELWGENPRTQATLNPIAEAIDKILAQAQSLAEKRAADLLAPIKLANDPRIAVWQKADDLAKLAKWTRARAAYRLAISYDKASPRRAEVCNAAIETLKDFEANVDAELAIAKLDMALGTPEGVKEANEYFDKVIAATSDDPKEPKKYVFQIYQAKYFKLVTALLNKQATEAQKGLPGLASWEEENLPTDAQTRLSMQSARAMLEYRVDASLSAEAKDPGEKQKQGQQAVGILMDLLAKRPDLKGIIFEQVLTQLPDDIDVSKLDPLVLEALIQRGIKLARTGVLHSAAPAKGSPPEDLARDAKQIQLGADAAREVVKRQGAPGISPAQVDNAAFSVGVLEEEIGTTPATALTADAQAVNRRDAAEAFLTYVDKFGANKIQAEGAMKDALNLVQALYAANPNDDQISALYDRALDIGIHKGGRARLNYYLGDRLRKKGDFAGAAKAYALVPADEPLLKIKAQYFGLVSDRQTLQKAEAGQTRSITSAIQKLSDELSAGIDAQLPKVDAAQKAALELYRVKATLITTDAARADKDFAREVKLLEGFEARVAEVQPASERDNLLSEALFLRVNALIALDRGPEAVSAVQALMKKNPKQAFVTVSDLVNKISTTYIAERNKANPDPATLTVLARQRAQLAAELVKQVNNNPSLPEKNKREYLDVNARAQVEAAKLEKDPATRMRYLNEALNTYAELLKGLSETDGDYASLQRLAALAEYEIGDVPNIQKAHDTLENLFDEKKFGTPMTRVGDESRPNEIYWEGLLYLLQCKEKLSTAKHDPQLHETAVRILKNSIIQFGDQTGGETYAKDFQALRTQLLGDWKPATSATQAAR